MSDTMQTVGIVNESTAKAYVKTYRQDRRVLDGIRQGLKSKEFANVADYLDGLTERVLAFYAESERLIEEGKGYTPPKDWGFEGNSLADIAEAILGQRVTDGKLRTLAAKAGK